MKCVKSIPLLLLLTSLCLAGCTYQEKGKIKAAAKQELDPLMQVNKEGVTPSHSYEELFSGMANSGTGFSGKGFSGVGFSEMIEELLPGTQKDEELLAEIATTYARFFEGFHYSLGHIRIDKDEEMASIKIKAKTRDGNALAKDYAKAQIREEMLRQAKGLSLPLSEKELYQLLGEVLETAETTLVETHFDMYLYKAGENWYVDKTYNLEDSLVGGFLSSAQDSFLLTPSETVEAWLETLKNMTYDEMSSYLGISSLEESQQKYAAALAGQIESFFNYQVLSAQKEDVTHASVQVSITSFSDKAIQTAYDQALKKYLSTAEAVIAGEEARYEKACQLLLECMKNNEITSSTTITFDLVHYDNGWALARDESNDLGAAIFGTLPGSLVSMEDFGEEGGS